jgi:hypothetical protein
MINLKKLKIVVRVMVLSYEYFFFSLLKNVMIKYGIFFLRCIYLTILKKFGKAY